MTSSMSLEILVEIVNEGKDRTREVVPFKPRLV